MFGMSRYANNLRLPEPPPGYQSTAGVLLDCALHRRLCLVRHFDGRVRVVEPYRIFRAKTTGRRLLTCYQIAGYTRGTGRAGWKNLYLEDLYAACPLDSHFDDRTAHARAARDADAALDPRDHDTAHRFRLTA